MKALVTGASSGIGREIAALLSERGYGLIVASRRQDRLEELCRGAKTPARAVACNLSDGDECIRLYEQTKGEDVGILVNCAGFGVFGPFLDTDLGRELEMLDVNIRALHILTKLFCRDFAARGSGYILNVASAAAFQPGPFFSSYYASKAYVLRLTEALAEELRRANCGVSVSAFCPGPVDTEFNRTAGVRFALKGIAAERAARCAVDGMFARKTVIVPGAAMRAAHFFERFLPERTVVRAAAHFQSEKFR